MEQVIKATELRIHTREIIERARFRGERFVIHTFGKPVAIIMGIEEYNALIQSLKQARAPLDAPVEAQPATPTF